MPGVKVVVPSGPYVAKGLLISALRDPTLSYFWSRPGLYRMIREEVPDGDYAVPLGQARILRKGMM
jgi:pyruvate dehydrogenase E1 component beta subunit